MNKRTKKKNTEEKSLKPGHVVRDVAPLKDIVASAIAWEQQIAKTKIEGLTF